MDEGNQEFFEKKSTAITLRISKKILIIFGILLAVAAVVLVVWKLQWYRPTLNWYNRSSVTIKVKEGETYAIEGATITVNEHIYTTDANGKASISDLVAGSYDFKVTKSGYDDKNQNISLKRGENDLQYVALRKTQKEVYAVKGFVQDYVGGMPLVDVKVSLGETSVKTDPSGAYSFENVSPGDIKLVLSKEGYAQKEMDLKLIDTDLTTPKVPLVPLGGVIFVSNRDGSRHIYQASYDGEDQKIFVEPKDGGEDFAPLLSPNSSLVAFSSTRDRVKSTYGEYLSKLYIAKKDGSGLLKISDDLSPTFTPIWSPGGEYLYFSGYTSPGLTGIEYQVYNTTTHSLTNLGESAYSPTFSSDGSLFSYYTTGMDGETYTNILKLVNLKTGDQKELLKKNQSFTGMQFSKDMSTLSYDMIVDNSARRFQINLVDLKEVEIPTTSSSKRNLVISPDDSLEAFVENRDGKRDLFITSLDGTNEKQLTTMGTLTDTAPVWDLSGRYLTVVSQKTGENGLYIVAVSGGDPQKITDVYLQSQSP